MSRVRGVLGRSGRALLVAGRALRRTRPRRCVGAVQAPRQLPADVVEVHGWAWFDHDELASCSVTIDGQVAATATLGPAAPDVARHRPETARASRCSWRAIVDLRTFSGRLVEVGAIATSARSVAQYLAPSRVSVTVASTPVPGAALDRRGGIEEPAWGALVTPGRLRVSGWALGDGRLPARLAVRVNGHNAGLARPFAQERPDLAQQYGDTAAPIAGFEHLIDIPPNPGTVRVDVDFVAAGGHPQPLRGVELRVAAGPTPAPPPRPSDVLAALDLAPAPSAPPDQLRVAVFTHSLDLGGGQLYLQELLRDLIKNEDTSCLVVSRTDGPLRDELEALGATVHVTDYPLPYTDSYEARTVELAVLARAYAAQVVVVNTLISAIGADVARRLHLPAVWAIHESFTLDDYWAVTCWDGRAPRCAAASAATMAETAIVLFVADATRAAYAETVGHERMTTLHCGIDIQAIDAYASTVDRTEARRATGVSDEADLLVCVGSVEPRKGQALLATAFALVADEFPRARLVLVGATDDPYSHGIRAFVNRLGLGGRIQVCDAEPTPFRWYRSADGVVVPSDLESMPRVLIEAMAFAVPVVATDIWGIPELVRPGENGLLCAPRDVEALADALREFLRLPSDARTRLGAAGSRLVRARHDLATYRPIFARLLHRLVADPDASVARLLAP